MSPAKVCSLPRDCGGQSRLRAGGKKSTQVSEVCGERGGQASQWGQTEGSTDMHSCGWHRRKRNFKYRREYSSWQLYILPNEPKWLGCHRVSQLVIHSFDELSIIPWAFRCRHLHFEVSGSLFVTQG